MTTPRDSSVVKTGEKEWEDVGYIVHRRRLFSLGGNRSREHEIGLSQKNSVSAAWIEFVEIFFILLRNEDTRKQDCSHVCRPYKKRKGSERMG